MLRIHIRQPSSLRKTLRRQRLREEGDYALLKGAAFFPKSADLTQQHPYLGSQRLAEFIKVLKKVCYEGLRYEGTDTYALDIKGYLFLGGRPDGVQQSFMLSSTIFLAIYVTHTQHEQGRTTPTM